MNGHKQSGGHWNTALGLRVWTCNFLSLSSGLWSDSRDGTLLINARSPQKRWRSIPPNCAITGRQRTAGGGPREFLYIRLVESQRTTGGCRGIVHYCSLFEISDTNLGNLIGDQSGWQITAGTRNTLEVAVFMNGLAIFVGIQIDR